MAQRFICNLFVFVCIAYIFGSPLRAEAAACEICPPLYCENPEAAQQAKERKKNSARSAGLPERLIEIIDRLPNCIGCIENSPDWVHITWRVDEDAFEEDRGYPPGYTIRSLPWSADVEKKIRDDMRRGVITEFHILHYSGVPCTCCPESTVDAYNDWRDEQEDDGTDLDGYNEDFDFHPDVGQSYTDKRQLGEDPADLTEIPETYRRPDELTSPPLEEFMDPAARFVQVICRECQSLADEYNALGDRVNGMRRDIARMRRDLYYDRQLINWVWRELDGIGLAATTDETRARYDELMDELGGHQRAFQRHKERLQEKLAERAELEAEMAQVLENLKVCEETACKPQKEATCALPDAHHKAITVGPNDKVGSGAAMKDKIKGQAKGMAMGALNNALGGSGLSFGGKSKKPKTSKDPLRKEDYVRFKTDEGLDIGVRAGFNDDGELLVSSKIFDAPGDGTFHAMWLEDGSGRRILPTRYLLFTLYRDWKISVWWTYDRYVNGDLVEHREGDSLTVGRDYMGDFAVRFEGADNIENAIWYQIGFNNASKGAQSIGAIFPVDVSILNDCPIYLVTHVSKPKADPVTTIPVLHQIPTLGEMFNGDVSDDKDNLIVLIRPTIIQQAEE